MLNINMLNINQGLYLDSDHLFNVPGVFIILPSKKQRKTSNQVEVSALFPHHASPELWAQLAVLQYV